MTTRAPLSELSRLHGVMGAYRAADGTVRRSPDDAVLRTLEVMGAPVSSLADVPDAVRHRRQELWDRIVEPVTVTWGAEPAVLPLRLPEAFSARVKLGVVLESGETLDFERGRDELQLLAKRVVDGVAHHRLGFALGRSLPFGYHRATVEVGEQSFPVLWIVAPQRAWARPGRRCGVFAPLYSLRSSRHPDCADLSDFARLSSWGAEIGVDVIGTLPLSAAFLEPPVVASPYAPVSRLFWNEVYLDLEALPELAACPEAREALSRRDVAVGDPDLVDWPRVASHRRRVLRLLAQRFFAAGGERDPGLRGFLAGRPEADRFARFRALGETRGREWRRWPGPLRDGCVDLDDCDPGAYRHHLYAQWRMQEQMEGLLTDLRGAGSDLYLDLPLGVHPDGFDPWSYRGSFLEGCTAGAPPDAFFTQGQNWAFQPTDPNGCRHDQHRYFRATIGHHLDSSGVLRLDHVMGLHRLFCIPEGIPPSDGVYVRQPAEELFAILVLESHRRRCTVIGEDLGTVPATSRRAMEVHGVKSMHILQFELGPGGLRRALRPSRRKLAALNTHDMATFAAFWNESDLEDRKDLGLLDEAGMESERRRRRRQRRGLRLLLGRLGHDIDPDDLAGTLRAVLLELARSDAEFQIVNLEDLWLELRPQNVPGTHLERPNWRRRMKPSVIDLCSDPDVRKLLLDIVAARGP